jgi:Protein of unknown function (DUF3987)
MTVIDFEGILNRARQQAGGAARPDPQQPLYRTPPEREQYPVRSLMGLQAPVLAQQYKNGAPVEITAGAMLSATALVSQALYDIELPALGRKPTSLFFATVGSSGERKSREDQDATLAIAQLVKEWTNNYEMDNCFALNAIEVWELQRRTAKREHKRNPSALKAALDALGPKPPQPMPPQLILEDATIEAVLMHLEKRPWAGIFSAEAGTLVGNSSFAEDRITHTAGRLNQLWDGRIPDRHRVGTGTQILAGRRCSLHLMLHPRLFGQLFGHPTLLDLGTFARWLVVYPDSRMGWRPTVVDLTPPHQEALDEYYRRIQLLADTQPTISHGGLEPTTLKLTDDAKTLFVAMIGMYEELLRKDGDYYEIRDFGAKLAEHTGRLAAVLAVYNNPRAPVVDENAIESGCLLAVYYANEMKRLRAIAGITEAEHITNDLRQWCLEYTAKVRREEFHLAEVYQYGPRAVRTPAIARAHLATLVETGWLEELPADIIIDGRKRQHSWQIRRD